MLQLGDATQFLKRGQNFKISLIKSSVEFDCLSSHLLHVLLFLGTSGIQENVTSNHKRSMES